MDELLQLPAPPCGRRAAYQAWSIPGPEMIVGPHSGRTQHQPEQGAIDRAHAHFWIERDRLDIRAVVAFLFADPIDRPRRTRGGAKPQGRRQRRIDENLILHPLRHNPRLLAAIAEEAVTAIRRRPPTTAERIVIADTADHHVYRES